MNISQIINSKEMPVNAKANINVNTAKVLDAVSAVTNGTNIVTEGIQKLIFIITGEFDGRISIYGQQSGTSVNEIVKPLFNLATGVEVAYIETPGVYYCENDYCYKKMWPRVTQYRSGTISAFYADGSGLEIPKAKTHIVKLGENLGVSVNANTLKNVFGGRVNQCAYVFVALRTDTDHAHKVQIVFTHPNTLGSVAPVKTIISSSLQRDGESDWIECKGTDCEVYINNEATDSAHTYDIIIYGVT